MRESHSREAANTKIKCEPEQESPQTSNELVKVRVAGAHLELSYLANYLREELEWRKPRGRERGGESLVFFQAAPALISAPFTSEAL